MASEPIRPVPLAPMSDDDKPPMKKGTLAAVVGAVAALFLLTSVPEEESGRTVAVTVAPDGSASVKPVAGKEYLTAYLDVAGVATLCDGLTKGVKLGQKETSEGCARRLEAELVAHAEGAMACSPGLRAPGRDWQRAAAVSFAYNVGVGAWCGSTARKRLDAGNVAGACDALLAWDKARVGGVLRPVKGLTRRRNRERQVCLTGLAGYPESTLQARLKGWR